MSELYFLDTGVFINGWRKHYSPSVFPGLWAEVAQLMDGGPAVSCHAVYEELKKKDDHVFDWVKPRRDAFHDPTEKDFLKLQEVMAAWPNLAAKGKSRNEADPFVIVQAFARSGVVVTCEEPQDRCSPTKPPKITYICDQLGIRRMTPCEFFEACGIRFDR